MNLHFDELHVRAGSEDCLLLRRVFRPDPGEAVLMLHGALSNGRIFCAGPGLGLAGYLADAGYDVYVADLRGRGGSRPRIARGSRHGQSESICDDLPALHAEIRRRNGGRPVHWLAHSWGGVLMASCLLRYPPLIDQVGCCVYFASKRSIAVHNWPRFFKIDLFWLRAAPLIAGVCGYLPARRLGIGADDETVKSLAQSGAWVRPGPWVDSDDGFDYGAAARSVTLPPTLYLAAADDPCLGHSDDIRRFAEECGRHPARLHCVGKSTGYRHDYDHVSLLTHPDAAVDHFPLVLRWLAGQYGSVSANL